MPAQNTSSSIIYVKNYIEKADEFWEASISLWLAGRFPLFTSPSSYLLHVSAELYLKTFLLDRGIHVAGMKTHNLWKLHEKCLENGFDLPNVDVGCLGWINQFGAFDGGIRYHHKVGGGYAVPLNIYELFEPIKLYIISNVGPEKDVSAQH